MVDLCPVVKLWSENRTEKASFWSKISGIWMVRQVTWHYHLNNRHPYCRVFRCIRYSGVRYLVVAVACSCKNKKLPVKNSRFLQYISQIDVRVQKVWIESHCFFKMVDGQPDFSLGIEHATQIAPGYGKVGSCLDGFQVTCLKGRERKEGGKK